MTITAEIRGMFAKRAAKAILASLPTGATLQLQREPSNQYDANAILVWVSPTEVPPEQRQELELALAGHGLTLEDFDQAPEWCLGYIGKEWAIGLAPLLDQGLTAAASLAFSGQGKPLAIVEVEG